MWGTAIRLRRDPLHWLKRSACVGAHGHHDGAASQESLNARAYVLGLQHFCSAISWTGMLSWPGYQLISAREMRLAIRLFP